MTDPQRTDWRENAACAKHPSEWWFAEGTGRDAQLQRAMALRICETCPVVQQCADWALEHPESSRFGIWGGMSGRRRVQLMGRPTTPDSYHTKAVTCACGTVFYCSPSRPMKHCSGACLDAARARASKAAQQRLRDERNPPDEKRLRNREAARRSRARARERAAQAGENTCSELESGATTECAGRLREQPPALGQGGSPDMRTEPRSVADVHSGGGT